MQQIYFFIVIPLLGTPIKSNLPSLTPSFLSKA